MRALAGLALLGCCLGFACVPVTYRAGVRRLAESHLHSCRKERDPMTCYAETRDYCAARGLERTCGEGYQP